MADLPPVLRPYSTFISDPFVPKGNQHVTTCPFCETERHLYLNSETGQGDCKKCGWKGNTFSFLKTIHESLLDQTTSKTLAALGKLRKVCNPTIFKDASVAACDDGDGGITATSRISTPRESSSTFADGTDRVLASFP